MLKIDDTVTMEWTDANYKTITTHFSSLEEAILTYRKLRKGPLKKRIMGGYRYKIGKGEWMR